MKTTRLSFGLLLLSHTILSAQIKPVAVVGGASVPNFAAKSEFAVSSRGPHHKIWERIEYEPTYDGKWAEHRHSYEELATGMHFRDEQGQWQESEEKIEILPNNAGAIAEKGQHKVIFPSELKSGIIELQTPDQQWLRSRVWGLAYFDSSSGQSVLLAEVKTSEGQLVGDNVVRYPDAFTDFAADVRYTYKRSGFEQDIVLRERPPAPEKFGLNPKTTRLQVLTEFIETHPPTKQSQQVGGMADEILAFQGMQIGMGKAFSVDAVGATAGQVPVAKGWQKVEGRDFLIEEVRYESVTEQLDKLPKASKYQGAGLRRRGKGGSVLVGLQKLLPKRFAKAPPAKGSKRMAQAVAAPEQSFVLDYVTLTTQTNFTYKGDTTYYVSGTVNLTGTTTIEGGTVVKFAKTGSAQININDPQLVVRTDA